MISKRLFILLYVVAIFGLFTYTYISLYNVFFEVFVLLLAFLNCYKIDKKIIPLMLASVLYLAVSYIYAVTYRDAGILDFFMIYKFFIYAIMLSFFVGKKVIDQEWFSKFFKFLIWIFFFKYIISILVFRNFRPILFYENNYELMLLSLLLYLYYIVNKEVSNKIQIVMTLIFLMSGSKSGLLILLFVLGVINFHYLSKKAHIIIPSVMLLGVLTLEVFRIRMGGTFNIEKIDRFKFLMVFGNEVRDWSLSDFVFGADRITALSSDACAKLGYYQSLFSYTGDGSCYSVIFHSYILRVIYDHGIMGLIFISLFVFYIVIISGFSKKEGLVVLGIAMLNGLSVSSFNSVYFVIGLIFYLMVRKNGTKVSAEDSRLTTFKLKKWIRTQATSKVVF